MNQNFTTDKLPQPKQKTACSQPLHEKEQQSKDRGTLKTGHFLVQTCYRNQLVLNKKKKKQSTTTFGPQEGTSEGLIYCREPSPYLRQGGRLVLALRRPFPQHTRKRALRTSGKLFPTGSACTSNNNVIKMCVAKKKVKPQRAYAGIMASSESPPWRDSSEARVKMRVHGGKREWGSANMFWHVLGQRVVSLKK